MRVEVKNEVVQRALKALRSDPQKDPAEGMENPARQGSDSAYYEDLCRLYPDPLDDLPRT